MSVTLFDQIIPIETFTFDNIEGGVQVRNEQRLSQHPVETGSDVTDHSQSLNTVLAFRGTVTTTPLGIPRPNAFEIAQTFFENHKRRLLTVVTPLGIFPNCLLQSFPRTATAIQKLPFDIILQQVKLASAVSVPIPARLPAPPQQTGVPSPVDVGAQATTESKSTLAAIADGSAALAGG